MGRRRSIRRWFSTRRENVRRATLEVREQARRMAVFQGLKKAMVASIVLAAIAGVVQLREYLMTTPRLALRTVEVQGEARATEWEIKILGQVTLGRNLLTLELEKMALGIERHPWVASVKLRRVYPDSLLIEVQERTPVALLAVGDLFYVDAEGTIFKKVKPGERLNFPVITGFENSRHLLKKRIGTQAIREALALLEQISKQPRFSADPISEIHVDEDHGYSVYTGSAGAQILLGWEAFDEKLDRLVELLQGQRLNLAQVRRVDLDFSRWAVVTPL